MGVRSCIGQRVAYRQVRTIVAKLAWKFEWEFINRDQVDWDRDTRVYATWQRPAVMAQFTPVTRVKTS